MLPASSPLAALSMMAVLSLSTSAQDISPRWQYLVDEAATVQGTAAASASHGQDLYLAIDIERYDGRSLVRALDLATGVQRWQVAFPGTAVDIEPVAMQTTPDGSEVYVLATAALRLDELGDKHMALFVFAAENGAAEEIDLFQDADGWQTRAEHLGVSRDGTHVVITGVARLASGPFGSIKTARVVTAAYETGTKTLEWSAVLQGGIAGDNALDPELAVGEDIVFLSATTRFFGSPVRIVTEARGVYTGILRWSRQQDGLETGDVAVAPDEQVVVVGALDAGAGNNTFAYRSADGATLWSVASAGERLAFAPDGKRVFGADSTGAAIPTEVHVRALDVSNGASLWNDVVDEGDEDEAVELSVASDGQTLVLVGGRSAAAPADIVTVAYSPASGVRRWTRVFDAEGHHARLLSHVVSADAGAVVVTGDSFIGISGPEFGTHTLALAYDLNQGTEVWRLLALEEGSGWGEANHLDVSRDGRNVYVVGDSHGYSITEPPALGDTWGDLIVALDSNTGRQVWAKKFGGLTGNNFVLSASTRVFLSTFGNGVFVLRALSSQTGNTLWTREDLGAFSILRMAATRTGKVVYATWQRDLPNPLQSEIVVQALDAATGTTLWETVVGDPTRKNIPADLVLSKGDGQLFVVGSSSKPGAAGGKGLALALDAVTGTQSWFNDTLLVGTRCALNDNASRLFVISGSRLFAMETIGGTELWSTPSQLWKVAAALTYAKALDRVVVVGRSGAQLAKYDFSTVAYDAQTGAVVWERSFDAGGRDEGVAVQLVNGGTTVLALGTSTDDLGAVAYDLDTGALLWTESFDGSGGGRDHLAASDVGDSGGRLYVAGSVEGLATGDDFAVLGYDVPALVPLTSAPVQRPTLAFHAGAHNAGRTYALVGSTSVIDASSRAGGLAVDLASPASSAGFLSLRGAGVLDPLGRATLTLSTTDRSLAGVTQSYVALVFDEEGDPLFVSNPVTFTAD